MTSTYRVVVQGLAGDGAGDRDEALRRLAALFKSGTDGVQRLLGPGDAIVKQGLTLAAAERYRDALVQCGCRVRIDQVVPDFAQPDFATIEGGAPEVVRFRHWTALAEQGDAEAQNRLGQMVRDGEGTVRDPARAAEWFRRSAEQGHPLAQYNLGAMYTDGSLPQDVLAAYRWMRIAAFGGEAAARAGVQALEPAIPLRDRVWARIVARDWVCKFRDKPEDASGLVEAQLGSIVPVLQRARAGVEAGNAPVLWPVADGLALSFVIDDAGQGGAQVIRQGMLGRLCMDAGELGALARQNRMDGVAGALRVIHMPPDQGRDAAAAPAFFRALAAPDGRAAGLVALPGTWETLAGMCRGAVRIAVPDADTLLFCGADEQVAFMVMCEAARSRFDEAGDAALSRQVLARDETGTIVVVPTDHVAMHEGETVAQVAGVSHPAGLALSDARLAKLQPENDDGGAAFLASVRDQMANGDSRAAVVVDADNAIVAAYSDDLDCVALLKFEPSVAHANQWRMGQRLLAVNSYATGDEYKARDLLPGEHANLRFKNFRPLIADLLTDDHERLAGRKADIGEEEWLRAMVLGKQAYLDRAVPPRDGRPRYCAQPGRPPRKAVLHDGPARPGPGIGDFFKALGVLTVCLVVIIGGLRHVGGMERDALFYLLCGAMSASVGAAAWFGRVLYYWVKPT